MSAGKQTAEDEDLDDLDDVLEQFTQPQPPPPKSTAIPPSSSSTSTTTSKSNPPAPPESDDALSEEFAKHLAEEMEAMMRQLSGAGGAASSSSGDGTLSPDAQAQAQQEAAFREAWDKMMVQDLEGNAKGNGLDTFLGRGDDPSEDDDLKENEKAAGVGKEKATVAAADEEDPFQKAIRQAMEKLQDSDDTLKADSRSGGDSLEGLLASLGDLKLGEGEGEGEGGEGLETMLETMMSQLMSKEILYEPLKELDTKYPDYLAQNSSTLSPDELSRYTDQKASVSQIVALFENPSYSDDNPAQSAEVLRLMNEMQSHGSPPSEIMGPMPAGFDLGTDGLPKIPDGCVIC